MNQHSSRWTEDRDTLLRELYTAGKSYSIIGIALGVSRSAVAGRVLRLGLSLRGRQIMTPEERQKRVQQYNTRRNAWKRAAYAQKRKEATKPAPLSTAVSDVPSSLAGHVLRTPIIGLKNHHCREVVGRCHCGMPEYCGAQVAYRSYCTSHARINYQIRT